MASSMHRAPGQVVPGQSLSVIVPVVVGLAALFEPLAYPFLFPGFLLLLVPGDDLSLSDRLVHAAFASLAFWMASLWPLSVIGLPLHWYCHGVTALSLAAFVWLGLGRGRVPVLNFRARDVVVLSVLAMVVYLRVRPLFIATAPSGADMSMHAYIVRLMAGAAGVPDSYQPLLSLDHFAAFPAGFHTIGAIFTLMADHPAWWSAFVMACMSHALFFAGLYMLVREVVGWREALAAAVGCALLLREPQGMVGWGGNPTVLGLAFVPMLFVAERMVRRGGNRLLAGGLCLLYLQGLCMSHGIVFMQTFYLSLLILPVAWLAGPRPDRGYYKTLAVVAVLFLALCIPYALRIDFAAIDDRVLDWIRNWVRETDHAWHGDWADALWTIPAYLHRRLALMPFFFWSILALAALGAGRLWFRGRRELAWLAAFAAGTFLLIVNCRYWLLPASYLVYPERTAAMLVLPLAVLAGAGLRLAAEFMGLEQRPGQGPDADRGGLGRMLWQGALAVALVFGVFDGEVGYTTHVARETTVTPPDYQAIEWIAKYTPEDAVIETNYVDAGTWIPALAGRRVTAPHVNIAVLYQNENPGRGDYLFTGAKPVYGQQTLKAKELLEQKDKYQLVFRAGPSCVFKRLD